MSFQAAAPYGRSESVAFRHARADVTWRMLYIQADLQQGRGRAWRTNRQIFVILKDS